MVILITSLIILVHFIWILEGAEQHSGSIFVFLEF